MDKTQKKRLREILTSLNGIVVRFYKQESKELNEDLERELEALSLLWSEIKSDNIKG